MSVLVAPDGRRTGIAPLDDDEDGMLLVARVDEDFSSSNRSSARMRSRCAPSGAARQHWKQPLRSRCSRVAEDELQVWLISPHSIEVRMGESDGWASTVKVQAARFLSEALRRDFNVRRVNWTSVRPSQSMRRLCSIE